MEILWAPWRINYIRGEKPVGCVFCLPESGQADREALVLHRSAHALVIMNRYPYNTGHLLIVPIRHFPDITHMSAAESADLMDLLILSKKVLEISLRPAGFNIGLNLGQTAGAGVDQHMHFHIVPRWNGDASFITVCGDTKVISQDLNETFDQLQPLFSELRQGDQKDSLCAW